MAENVVQRLTRELTAAPLGSTAQIGPMPNGFAVEILKTDLTIEGSKVLTGMWFHWHEHRDGKCLLDERQWEGDLQKLLKWLGMPASRRHDN
jgi:hypothetical protein